MVEKLRHAEITGQIIGCAMRVHSVMRNGHREVVYQRCLAIEMTNAGLSFIAEADMPIYFQNQVVGRRRIDFIVENCICVETKALACLGKQDLAQAINNLETHRLGLGLLINFGADRLEYRRVYNNKLQQTNP